MFDLISGLFQANKMIEKGHVPGCFIKGMIETIIEQDFFRRLIQFSIKITLFMEAKLAAGEKVPNFRLSYSKVMWRDI